MKKTTVLLAAFSTMVLVSCAMSDDDQVINDQDEPGVQEPGSSDASQRTCGTRNLSSDC